MTPTLTLSTHHAPLTLALTLTLTLTLPLPLTLTPTLTQDYLMPVQHNVQLAAPPPGAASTSAE